MAGRINSTRGAKASGEVLVNGQKRNYNDFRKLAAYVLQDDNMFAELTVEEQLTYAALLRLPPSMSREKKLMRVNRVIQELGLSKVRNTMLGNDLVRGISGGERKRVNIGTELVTDPSLLFLDEPTTGLDSFNALNVMSTLRHLASNGRTVVSTIHQPRSSIFAMFDQLCLLSEGRVMYFGPAKEAIEYFSRLNFRSPSNFNPADFFLDLLSIDPRSPEREVSTKARVKFLGDKHVEKEIVPEPLMSHHGGGGSTSSTRHHQQDIETGNVDLEKHQQHEGHVHTLDSNDVHADLKDRDYQSNWINEFIVLCSRAFKLAVRERAANGARFGQVIFFSIILGLIWLRKGEKGTRTQTLPGILFFVVINQAFGGSFAVIFGFPLEKSVVIRERAANTYRTSSYYLSKMITDMPKTLFFNMIFCIILYWMVGFRTDAGAFFIFVLTIFLVSTLAESLALTISVMAGDAQAAAALIPVFVIIALLFGGFFLEDEQLSDWIGWLKYTSFIFYGFNALVKNEFADLTPETVKDEFFERYNNLSVAGNLALVFTCLVFYRMLGFIFLHYLRGPKFLKF